MLTSDDKKIAWKVGLLLAGVHLFFSLFIWITVWRGGDSEGWLYVAILHLPSFWLAGWLFPNAVSALGSLPDSLVFCGFATILWFIFGWTMTRIVTLYG